MPKFTQIGANASPAIGDFIIGHTVAGVDDKITIGQLAALVSANLSAKALIDLGFNTTSNAGAVIPTAWTTYCTVTATSHGGAVRLSGLAQIKDGNSGAARTGHIRVQCDGVTITNSDRIWQTINSGAYANGLATTLDAHTPSAGSHTWTLQVAADTGSATTIFQTNLWVAEAMP